MQTTSDLHCRGILGAVLVTVMMSAPFPAAAQTYTITNVVLPPGDINATGQIVGATALWDQGVLIDLELETSRGYRSGAKALNDRGQVVGDLRTVQLSPISIRHYAFLWQDGVVTDLGTLSFARFDIAFAVNNAGQVVGFEFDAVAVPGEFICSPFDGFSYGFTQAFVWEEGMMTALNPPSPSRFTQARAINDIGQIAGFRLDLRAQTPQQAVIWENGTMILLPGESGEAHAINDLSQVVGRVGSFLASQAVLWEDRQIIPLGTLGGDQSGAWDLNNRGQVVGSSETNVTGANGCPIVHAFLWQDGRMIDLNDVLRPESGWELLEARAINDRGQIAGSGLLNGDRLGFLLTPILGDFDRDGDVDLSDFMTMQACFAGPGEPLPDDPTCEEADLDFDGDVDLADLLAFQAHFTGSQ